MLDGVFIAFPELYHLFLGLVDEQVELVDVHLMLVSLLSHLLLYTLLLRHLITQTVPDHYSVSVLKSLLLQLPVGWNRSLIR